MRTVEVVVDVRQDSLQFFENGGVMAVRLHVSRNSSLKDIAIKEHER